MATSNTQDKELLILIAEQLRSGIVGLVYRDWSASEELEKILNRDDRPPDERLYAAVKQAIQLAKLYPSHGPDFESRYQEFQAILERQLIRSVYQPIVSLGDAKVFGYEALSRGPEESRFHSPLELFRFAEKNGDLYRLDTLARQKAMQGLGEGTRSRKVFINIPAQIIHDPEFTPGKTMKMLEAHGLKPEQIVFEITERSSIEDFETSKRILSHYRGQGYEIAIDDAGAGYSSLQAIAELQPDYIKIERSLVHNVHRDKVKEAVLETFVTFAQKLNIPLIAEGIEQPEDLIKLMRLGVQLGQGYLLGKPDDRLNEVTDEGVYWIKSHGNRSPVFGYTWTIGELAQPISKVDRDTPVLEVWEFFELNPRLQGAVITDGEAPVGLIMREKLYWTLAERYGKDLYWNRTIDRIMDNNPLIVEHDVPVEQVSQLAIERDYDKLYDFVIIRKAGALMGIASVRSVLECLTNIRTENARFANPLTGLPGNIRIQRELSQRLLAGESFSVIYADLDYFKWYNDKYGFHRGDELICYTAETLLQAVAMFGQSQDFVGHIGGDDFIVATVTDKPELLCREMIQRFESGIAGFYGPGVPGEVIDRDGNRVGREGVSLSLALVVCPGDAKISVDELSHLSSRVKKKAKQHAGSVYYMEKL